MSLLCIIPQDDGYTEPLFIKEEPRVHPAIRGRFRPMSHPERVAIERKLRELPPPEASHLQLEAVCRFVKEWDIVDEAKKLVPLDPSKAKLKPSVLDHVYWIAAGMVGSDVDPDQLPTKESSHANLTSILDGIDVGSAREAADVKN